MEFSIVTPSFNSGRWLPMCLASVADQGISLEHLIQDGGSTDGTLEMVRERSGTRLEVARDTGMYDALNRGFDRAGGELFAYLNCDEQYLPGALASAHDFFDRHVEVDIAFAHTVVTAADGAFLSYRKAMLPTLTHTVLCHLGTLSASMFFRRRLFENGFRFDPSFRANGDVDWIARLLSARIRMAVIPLYTSVFTMTGANASETPVARAEQSRLIERLPRWRRAFKPLTNLRHRMRKLISGSYRQAPFSYSLYTLSSPGERVAMESGPKPDWRWPSRRGV
jgi:glycosyltransferase involved in cell wall biosynthesis